MPIMAAPAIRTDSITTAVMPRPRAMKVAAVAQPSAARTKNCHGCSCWLWVVGCGCGLLVTRVASLVTSCLRPTRSVEIAELIVQPRLDVGIDRGRRRGFGLRAARPPDGSEADHHGAGRAERIRQEPRQAV